MESITDINIFLGVLIFGADLTALPSLNRELMNESERISVRIMTIHKKTLITITV